MNEKAEDDKNMTEVSILKEDNIYRKSIFDSLKETLLNSLSVSKAHVHD